MIVSKSNLLVVSLTAVDKNIPVLDCVRIEEDGSTIGGNGNSFIAVSPVDKEIKEKINSVFKDEESNPVTITSETAKEVIKNIPNDIRFKGMLEHTEVVCTNDKSVSFNLNDGAREKTIYGKINPLRYPDYKNMFKRCLSNKKNIRLVVNAKRLLPLIETIMKISEDNGDFSRMYIEFTEEKDIILRMQNPKTKQRAIGLMWCYKGNENVWLEPNQWEEGLKNGNNDIISDKRACVNTDNTNMVRVNSNCNNNNVHIRNSSTMVYKNKGAKKTGNKDLAHIIKDSQCPECKKHHLATDGRNEWCSSVSGCNYFKSLTK